MPYNVFLSYSWLQSAERRALQAEIGRIKSVKVLVDKSDIAPGEPVHARILQMIDAADCVIVLLTDEGLQSHEVMDEISRSHDRGKFIIPIVAKGVKLEALPWYVRDLNWIKYDNRNFDEVVEALVRAVSMQANPIDNPTVEFPERLQTLIDSGVRFIDIPMSKPHRSLRLTFIYCELRMRETGQCFVFRASRATKIGRAAGYLAKILLPHFRRESYDWTFVYNERLLPGHHTLETAGIRDGDFIYLEGDHRAPRPRPC